MWNAKHALTWPLGPGGLLGAIFNFCNKWIHTTRVKLKHPVVQGLEMLALGLTTSVLFYIIPYYYPSCKYGDAVLAYTYLPPPS